MEASVVASSVDGTKAVRNKRLKLQEKVDRISALPDSLIHHILSFLPSTKEAIRTGVLSKRWQNQWTRVPVLIFDFPGISSLCVSEEDISRMTSNISGFIDNTLVLHECSKIKKFIIRSKPYYKKSSYNFTQDPNGIAKLRFAIRKGVEELILNFEAYTLFRLPNFLFSHTSLVKLEISSCSVMPTGRVYWECLTHLLMENCIWPDEAIKSVVSGSPLLASLEVNNCRGVDEPVIASKSLKRFVLVDPERFDLDISCPYLEELYIISSNMKGHSRLSDGIGKILSGCPLLHSLELVRCNFKQLVIASKYLKKLVVGDVQSDTMEISCPNLEELNLYDLTIETIRLKNLPSAICAALDFHTIADDGFDENVHKQILEQLQQLNELKIGSPLIETLSASEMEGISYPLLNCKSLIMHDYDFADGPGIVCALRSSPALERLVVKLRPSQWDQLADLSDPDLPGVTYWTSNGTSFSCLVSQLRTVEIIGFTQREDNEPKIVLAFVEFLLKTARVLEKIIITLEDCESNFVIQVSQKLLSFPRCSNAIVELLCSNAIVEF